MYVLRLLCAYLVGLCYDRFEDVTVYIFLKSVNCIISYVCVFLHLFVHLLCDFFVFYRISVQFLGLDHHNIGSAIMATMQHSIGPRQHSVTIVTTLIECYSPPFNAIWWVFWQVSSIFSP